MPHESHVQTEGHLVSERELAQEWGCHRSTVARLLREADIQAVFLSTKPGGTKRYHRSDVEGFLQSRETKAAPADGGV